jgi:hypothetical protein
MEIIRCQWPEISFNEGASMRVEHANRRQTNNLGVHRNPRLTLFNPDQWHQVSATSSTIHLTCRGDTFYRFGDQGLLSKKPGVILKLRIHKIYMLMCIYTYIYICIILFSEMGTNLWQGSCRAFILIIHSSSIVLGFAPGASKIKKYSVQNIPQCGSSNNERTASPSAKFSL